MAGARGKASEVTVRQVPAKGGRRRRVAPRVWSFDELAESVKGLALEYAGGDRSRVRVLGPGSFEVKL